MPSQSPKRRSENPRPSAAGRGAAQAAGSKPKPARRRARAAADETAKPSQPAAAGARALPHFRREHLFPKLQATQKEGALEELVAGLVHSGALEAAQARPALRALVERERLASTGVGMNVAIPHVQLKGLERAVFSLGLHEGGLEWDALDGAAVHLIFVVLRPERGTRGWDALGHLEAMGWIARLARDPDFRRFARAVRAPQELHELLLEKADL